MGSAATSGRTCACPDPVPGNEGPGWTLLHPGGGGPPLPAGGGGPPVSPPGPPRPPGGGGPPRPPDAGGAGLIAGGGAGGGATPCPGGGATPRPLPSGTPRPPGAPGEAPAIIQQSRSGRSDTASMRLAQTLRQKCHLCHQVPPHRPVRPARLAVPGPGPLPQPRSGRVYDVKLPDRSGARSSLWCFMQAYGRVPLPPGPPRPPGGGGPPRPPDAGGAGLTAGLLSTVPAGLLLGAKAMVGPAPEAGASFLLGGFHGRLPAADGTVPSGSTTCESAFFLFRAASMALTPPALGISSSSAMLLCPYQESPGTSSRGF